MFLLECKQLKYNYQRNEKLYNALYLERMITQLGIFESHNRYWTNLDVLTITLDDWFNTFTKLNEKLVSLCSFAWCNN